MNSVLLYHTACPRCREEGADRTGNNLGIYSDGHHYCYRCGYMVATTAIRRFTNKDRLDQPTKRIALPEDVDTSLPLFAREWLEQKYEFNSNTITNNKILWSNDKKYLIFPYYIGGTLEAWQGRVFDQVEKEKRKWFSQGDLNRIIYTIGRDTPCLLLTESIISAIKTSRYIKSAPVWGSVITSERWARLSRVSDNIIIWYDPDKKKEAIDQAKLGELFVDKVTVIQTDRKPKDYSYDDIRAITNEHTGVNQTTA